MLGLLENPFFICLLAALSPTIAFASVNTRFFTASQIVRSCFLATLLSFLPAIVVYCLSQVAQLQSGSVGVAVLSTVTGLVIFSIFSERMLTELTRLKHYFITLVVVAILFVSLSVFISPAVITGLLLIYFLFSLYDLIKKYTGDKEFLLSDKLPPPPQKTLNEAAHTIKRPFIHKPNVYLLVLESMHSEKAAEMIYGISRSEEMDEFYKANQLVVNEGFYSNKASTVQSMIAMLENRLSNTDHELIYPPYVLGRVDTNCIID